MPLFRIFGTNTLGGHACALRLTTRRHANSASPGIASKEVPSSARQGPAPLVIPSRNRADGGDDVSKPGEGPRARGSSLPFEAHLDSATVRHREVRRLNREEQRRLRGSSEGGDDAFRRSLGASSLSAAASQAATSAHRKRRTALHPPGPDVSPDATSSSTGGGVDSAGGSVAASESATARYRRERRPARLGAMGVAALPGSQLRSNPSSLSIPLTRPRALDSNPGATGDGGQEGEEGEVSGGVAAFWRRLFS